VSALRLLALLLALGPAPALAQPRRAAVIILANRPATQALADDLTEVAMARVAQRRVEVVGTREFRGRLGMLRDPRACLADASCVARVAVELTVTRILVGSLAMEPNRYLFHLTLWDLPAGAPRNRVFRVVEGPLEDLVRIVQEATDAVLLPRLEPGRIQIDSEPRGARVFVDNVLLGVTPMLSPERLEIRLSPQHLPLRRRWPGYVAWSTGGGALLAGAGGVLLAAQSQGARADATRQEAMLDFQRRQRLGSVSTAVLLSSALLAGISAYHFLRYHRDIFGRADPLP
jgi:hypothetical protein